MSEKNAGRPPSPLQGQALWSFAQISQLKLSTQLLFDQMFRNYARHVDGHDEEGDNFKHELLQRITEKNEHLKNLIGKIAENKIAETQTNVTSIEEEVKEQINQIHALLKIHTSVASDEANKLKREIQIYLATLEKDIEYYTIAQKIVTRDTETENQVYKLADPSIPDIDQEITPRPTPKFSYRRSTRLQDTADTTKNVKSQLHTTKRQNKELEKLNEECEELQLQLAKTQKESIQLRQSLEETKEQLDKYKQDNETLYKDLEETKQEKEAAQQCVQEINNELAQLRNAQREIESLQEKETIIEDSFNNEEITQTSSPANTDEEQEIEETSNQQLPNQSIRNIMKQIKEINQESALEEESKKQYQQGYKLLKNDFLRFGRKTWSTKTVETYLKLLVNKKNLMTKQTLPEDCSEQGMDLISQIFRLNQGLKVLGKMMEKFHEKIKIEIETLKTKRSQFLPLQTLHQEFETSLSIEYIDITTMTQELTEKLKKYITINPNNLMIQLNDHIKQVINKSYTQTKAPNKTYEMKELMSEEQGEKTNQQRPSKQTIRKLVLIPNEAEQIEEVSKQLRENLKNPEVRGKIKTIKKTLNNNIEICTLDTEVETLKELLETGKIQDQAKIIEPMNKQMKILLLRVPNDISETDLQMELERIPIFQINKPEIIKSFPVTDTLNNWIIKSSANICRSLIQKGKIKIFTDQIRVVRHIQILRCANCQALEDHTTLNCKYTNECATCAEEHQTNTCTSTHEKCINCKREGLKDTSHKASSIHCPIFMKYKSSKLNNYYGPQKRAKKTIENKTVKQNRETEQQRGYSYRNKQSERIERPGHSKSQREERREFQSRQNDYRRKTEQRSDRKEEMTRYHTNEIRDRNGDIRTISMRIFENSNRAHYQYPKHTREAMPPYRR